MENILTRNRTEMIGNYWLTPDLEGEVKEFIMDLAGIISVNRNIVLTWSLIPYQHFYSGLSLSTLTTASQETEPRRRSACLCASSLHMKMDPGLRSYTLTSQMRGRLPTLCPCRSSSLHQLWVDLSNSVSSQHMALEEGCSTSGLSQVIFWNFCIPFRSQFLLLVTNLLFIAKDLDQ